MSQLLKIVTFLWSVRDAWMGIVQDEWLWYLINRILYPVPPSTHLKIPRLQFLKNTLRIILPANLPQSLLIRRTVASKHVLVRGRVVLIDVSEVQSHSLSGGHGVIDNAVRGRSYARVVGWGGPIYREVCYWNKKNTRFCKLGLRWRGGRRGVTYEWRDRRTRRSPAHCLRLGWSARSRLPWSAAWRVRVLSPLRPWLLRFRG